MKQIIKYLPFYFISLLPLTLLYGLSDVLTFILYYIVGYRKKVVRQNLMNSFPDKTLKEIILIEKQFYRYLGRIIVETIKLLTISKNELRKRCKYSENFHQIFNHYNNEKKNIMVLMGHLGNWEWAGASFNLYFPHHLFVLYHPLSNKYFDELMKIIRTRLGTQLIPMHTSYKHILNQHHHPPAVFTFIADQCPSPQNAFWMKFLNQDTPVYYAPELIAKKLYLPVVFVWMKQIKKGNYLIDATEITINNENQYPTQHIIMEKFMELLEEKIKEQPYIWLWSHKRWKHKKTF
ncbi:MAG: lysophospholipid acyltransferase family protein [Bacteroidota bacterium]